MVLLDLKISYCYFAGDSRISRHSLSIGDIERVGKEFPPRGQTCCLDGVR